MSTSNECDGSETSTDMSTPSFSCFSFSTTSLSPIALTQYQYHLCIQASVKWKAKQLKRKRENAKRKLTKEDIVFIRKNTKMTKDQIKIWFQKFLQTCPSAQLTKSDIVDQVAKVFPAETGEAVADLIFKEFDIDMNGWLDFTEFLVGIHCLATCQAAEQLRWAFRMMDSDRSGTIQVKELVELFGTLYLHEGLDPQKAVRRAVAVFTVLDVDNDLCITEEEFIIGCMKDKQMMDIME